MSKFGRKYKLTVEIDTDGEKPQAIEITNPLTLQYDIERNTSSSLNQGTLNLYNLSEKNRNIIFQNRFDMVLEMRFTSVTEYV